MNTPLRVRYGAYDNHHELLEWEGHPAPLPTELLGLTDRPGNSARSEGWWPSVGCGPVGEWWALWWTMPDNDTPRAGMVRSEVALWRRHEVGNLDDLRPTMKILSGQETILPSSADLMNTVAEALVNSNPLYPPILLDLKAWPGIIADLWMRLWPEARRAFTARVALSPSQTAESATSVWIYASPPTRESEWWNYPLIHASPSPKQVCRAAAWLAGLGDARIEEIWTCCDPRPSSLEILNVVGFAANRLDKIRESADLEQARDLLRDLEILAPKAKTAVGLKEEALKILKQGMAQATFDFIRSLRNIDSAFLPNGSLPETAITAWADSKAPALPLSDASVLLDVLRPGKGKIWWQQAMTQSLSNNFENPDPHWAKAALNWLSLPECDSVMDSILPKDNGVETCLLTASAHLEISDAGLQEIRRQTTRRRWSRLHAWAVMQALPLREALQAQRVFPHEPLLGLEFLVGRLPGAAVVEEAISTNDPEIIQLLAPRTAREPELLRPLDASKPAWLVLWAAHINVGGGHWPESANSEELGNGLLDAMLAGNGHSGLVVVLAKDLGGIALQHPKRAELWTKLSHSGNAALLPQVADALIRQCNISLHVPMPERQLADAVIDQLHKNPPSAKMLAEVLTWDVSLSENKVIRWLKTTKSREWEPSIAAAFGQTIYSKKWENVASEIYDLYIWKSRTEFKPALEACWRLLSFLRRLYLSSQGIGDKANASDQKELVRRVAELGAELAPDKLEYIWERAGGKRKQLRQGGSPSTQWQEAANLASQGTLEKGLLALVRELKKDFQHNKDLGELEKLLSDIQRSTKLVDK